MGVWSRTILLVLTYRFSVSISLRHKQLQRKSAKYKNDLLHIKCTILYLAGVFYKEYLLNRLRIFNIALNKYSDFNVDQMLMWANVFGWWQVLSGV